MSKGMYLGGGAEPAIYYPEAEEEYVGGGGTSPALKRIVRTTGVGGGDFPSHYEKQIWNPNLQVWKKLEE